MCWIGSMRDDEVVVVRRCRRFSTYSGYLSSFRCTGARLRSTAPCACTAPREAPKLRQVRCM